jgi:hypothetical protein
MSAFVPVHIERSHSFVVDLPLGRAFSSSSPRANASGPKVGIPSISIPPGASAAARGNVFRTGHGGEETLWTIVRHEPGVGIVEYVRATPGSRMGMVLVQCMPLEAARTRVTVVYSLTALSEKGNEVLRKLDAPAYEAFIRSWEEAIRSAITT